tara:strand:+ start:486 stop:710 length:225 start_codon:yes stop_codon:yes gene_type:complete
MLVNITKKCFAGTGQNLMPGSQCDLPERIAGKLISRGYADLPKKPARKTKSDRAITEVSTPEDDELVSAPEDNV